MSLDEFAKTVAEIMDGTIFVDILVSQNSESSAKISLIVDGVEEKHFALKAKISLSKFDFYQLGKDVQRHISQRDFRVYCIKNGCVWAKSSVSQQGFFLGQDELEMFFSGLTNKTREI